MKKHTILLIAVATLTAAASAWGGMKYATMVDTYGDATSGTLYGSLGATRNSPDSQSYIDIWHDTTAYSSTVWIYAYNSNYGAFGYCYSSAPSIVTATREITDSSYIYAHWNSNHECTNVSTRTGSGEPPKSP